MTLTIPSSVHNAAWEAWQRAIATPGAHVFAKVVGPVYEAWERAAWQIPATRPHDGILTTPNKRKAGLQSRL